MEDGMTKFDMIGIVIGLLMLYSLIVVRMKR